MALQDHIMWRRPQHHMDMDHEHEHVHWVELFYDLAHVVTIFLLGNYLSDHLNWSGFGVFVLMFIVLWFAWGEISVFNSIYYSTDYGHRMIMAMAILTVLLMAAAIPSVTGGGWPYFAIGFAVNRLVIALLYFRARRIGSQSTSMANEMVRNFTAYAIIFAIAAFLPRPLAYYVFIGGLLVQQFIYTIPTVSIMRYKRFRPRWGHISERFALLTLIVIGESFFKLTVTLADKGVYKVGPEVMINFFAGGIVTFVMAWIYFDQIANAKTKNENIKTLVTYWLAHIVLMLSAVMMGVSLAAEIKVGFWQPFPPAYAAIGCAGLIGYIAMIWILQNQIEFREAHRFTPARLRIFGIVLAAITFVLVPYIPALIGNILWGTALVSQILWPMIRIRQFYLREDSNGN